MVLITIYSEALFQEPHFLIFPEKDFEKRLLLLSLPPLLKLLGSAVVVYKTTIPPRQDCCKSVHYGIILIVICFGAKIVIFLNLE
jgi:hypothetical protein